MSEAIDLAAVEARVIATNSERRAVVGALRSMGWAGFMKHTRGQPRQIGPLVDAVVCVDRFSPREEWLRRIGAWLEVHDEDMAERVAQARRARARGAMLTDQELTELRRKAWCWDEARRILQHAVDRQAINPQHLADWERDLLPFLLGDGDAEWEVKRAEGRPAIAYED